MKLEILETTGNFCNAKITLEGDISEKDIVRAYNAISCVKRVRQGDYLDMGQKSATSEPQASNKTLKEI